MSRAGHIRNGKDAQRKKEISFVRTMDRLEGKLALAAEWERAAKENPDLVDPEYMKSLRLKIDSYRSQLKIKNGLMERLEI